MIRNVPDDWDNYWYKCTRCGQRAHESEQHDCEEEKDMTETQITIRIYHSGLDDTQILDEALHLTEKLKDNLEQYGDMVKIPAESVVVHTAPFNIE